MTIVVDWDIKPQNKQTNEMSCGNSWKTVGKFCLGEQSGTLFFFYLQYIFKVILLYEQKSEESSSQKNIPFYYLTDWMRVSNHTPMELP